MNAKPLITLCAGTWLALAQPAAESATVDVNFINSGFNPNSINIKTGDTVIWRNLDILPMVLGNTADSVDKFLSPAIVKGETFSKTFNVSGTEYYQNRVGGATGSILIRPATGPATFNIDIRQKGFDPPALTVNVGDTIIWKLVDTGSPAILSFAAGSIDKSLISPTLLQGQTFAFTFLSAGTDIIQDLVNGNRREKITILPAPTPVPIPPAFSLFGSAIAIVSLSKNLANRRWLRSRKT